MGLAAVNIVDLASVNQAAVGLSTVSLGMHLTVIGFDEIKQFGIPGFLLIVFSLQ